MTPGKPVPSRADAVIVGSGIAGLSSAVRLCERGRQVVLVEEAPRLGGRATSFVDKETNESVDNGQHALFGCYRDTYDFLRRIGAAHLAPLQPTLSLTMAGDGRLERLECPRLPSPWHLLAGLMRWRGVGIRDRLSAFRLFGFLRDVASKGPAAVAASVPPQDTVSDWLRHRGQSPELCRWLWNPLAFAALNQAPAVAAATTFVRVVAELFAADADAAAIGLPSVPLDSLFAVPSAALIERSGGVVLSRTTARVLVDEAGRLRGVRAGDTEISAPAVISAVPWHAFDRLWDGDPPEQISGIAKRAAAMTSSPIVTVNLWLDAGDRARDLHVPAFFGFADGPMHWVFVKRELVEGASHLAVVASGADDIVRADNNALTRVAFEQITQAIPEWRTRTVTRSVVVREVRATFSLAPGQPPRPGTTTPVTGFFLAGDWTDTGLPGTIESAVRSGYAAADAAS